MWKIMAMIEFVCMWYECLYIWLLFVIVYYQCYNVFRSHMKCGTYICHINVFDSVEAAAATGSNLYPGSSILNITVIPIIFWRLIHVPWVVPECSAKFWPNCSSFHKMVANLNKASHFCTFLQISFGYSKETWQGHCLG